jgi:hypothetical protein
MRTEDIITKQDQRQFLFLTTTTVTRVSAVKQPWILFFIDAAVHLLVGPRNVLQRQT